MSAEPNKRLVADEQPITLAMIDGPDRILADLPAAPQWFRDKNWLALETDGARSMQDAVSGEPVVDEPTTALTAVDLVQAIQQRQTKKELEDDSNKEDKGDAEITSISPRLKQLLTDLGDATDGSSLFTFNHDVSKLAYVSDQGLNVFDLKSKQTKTIPAESPNHLVGKLDWVYQEELYGRGNFKGFWWQPDGDQIAFLELDETPLTPFVVMDHLPVLGKSEVTNYPKAGDSNPLVRVGVTSAAEPSQSSMDRPVGLQRRRDRRQCGDLVARRFAVDVADPKPRANLAGSNRHRRSRSKWPSALSRQHTSLDRIAGRSDFVKQW